MPRKAKEKIGENEIIDEKLNAKKKTSTKKTSSKTASTKKTVAKKSTTKKASAKKSATTKTRKSALAQIIENIDISDVEVPTVAKKKTKSNSSKSSAKKSATKKNTEKTTTKKKAVKKDDEKKVTSKIATKKSGVTKKETASKTTKATKTKASKKADSKEFPFLQISEYYDLPYKYGNTVVKLLAQTPNTLFVYWEVSETDIANFKKLYGEDFFNKTTPILIVHNLTQNKKYEVEINDFANCWYLNTDDSDCKFDIELARKFTDKSKNQPDYLYIATSNNLRSPNDHILFEKIKEFVVFRDVNSDNVIKKNIKSFKFLKDIYKFYKDMYDEDVLNNPSSQFKF